MKRFWQCALLAAIILTAMAGSSSAETITWDKSSIELTGQCLPDGTAEFTVRNTGRDMAGASAWREYEADALTADGTFQLAAGAAQTWTFGPLPGVAIRFEADQRPGHPGSSQPRLTLTCGGPTALKLTTFSASSAGPRAGNRGGCNKESRAIGLACTVQNAGVGWVSGTCLYGEYFLAQTARTFSPGQSVTVSGCVDQYGTLFSAPGFPLRIRKQ